MAVIEDVSLLKTFHSFYSIRDNTFIVNEDTLEICASYIFETIFKDYVQKIIIEFNT